jgi:hypothetical protein
MCELVLLAHLESGGAPVQADAVVEMELDIGIEDMNEAELASLRQSIIDDVAEQTGADPAQFNAMIYATADGTSVVTIEIFSTQYINATMLVSEIIEIETVVEVEVIRTVEVGVIVTNTEGFFVFECADPSGGAVLGTFVVVMSIVFTVWAALRNSPSTKKRLAALIYLEKKVPTAMTSALTLWRVSLAVLDLITDFIFVVWLNTCEMNANIEGLAVSSAFFFVVPVLLNGTAFVQTVKQDTSFAFAKHLRKHKLTTTIASLLAMTNVSSVLILDSHLLGLQMFQAEFGDELRDRFDKLGLISHILEDFPQFIIQLYFISTAAKGSDLTFVTLSVVITTFTLVTNITRRCLIELTNNINNKKVHPAPAYAAEEVDLEAVTAQLRIELETAYAARVEANVAEWEAKHRIAIQAKVEAKEQIELQVNMIANLTSKIDLLTQAQSIEASSKTNNKNENNNSSSNNLTSVGVLKKNRKKKLAPLEKKK